MNRIVTFLLLIFSFNLSAELLDEKLHAIHQEVDFPGWSIAVVNSDGLLYEHHEGFADLQKQKPFTDATLINIASVSKTFVAMAIAAAIEEGYFTLNTPINELLPFPIDHPREPDQPILMRHLVTHTSGIRDRAMVYYFKAYIDEGKPTVTLDTFIRRYFSPDGKWWSKRNFNKHPPGQYYEYSNIGAALAAWIIESVTGSPFSDYSNKRTLTTIGMKDSAWHLSEIDREMHAINYNKRMKVIKPYSLATYPDGGLRSNIVDLSKYLIEVIRIYQGTSEIFSGSIYRDLFRLQHSRDLDGLPDQLDGVGVFWELRSNGLIGHSGGDPGISSFLFFDPVSGIGRIFLTNVDIKNKKQARQFKLIWDAVGEVYGKVSD